MALPSIRTLLIDNYDSYTYNLYQLIAKVNGGRYSMCCSLYRRTPFSPALLGAGVPPKVLRNDELDILSLLKEINSLKYDNIVISPGPGTPCNPGDIGVCMQLLQSHMNIPILGVCLGFQALALAYGALVRHAPEPVHGRLSAIEHAGNHPLFSGIPSGQSFKVVRYHSLSVEESSLPGCLTPLAWTTGFHNALNVDSKSTDNSRVLMALGHSTLPHYGVQFHPESIATSFGEELLINFRDITINRNNRRLKVPLPESFRKSFTGVKEACKEVVPLQVCYQVLSGILDDIGDPEKLFVSLYDTNQRDTFWLDSSATDRGRFSFMGGRGGPLWRKITFKLPPEKGHPGTLTQLYADGTTSTDHTLFFDWLDSELQRFKMNEIDLPFDFWGGFVGYLGYELKAECGGDVVHQSDAPDAALFLADRIIVIDHEDCDVYVLAMSNSLTHQEQSVWMESTADLIQKSVRNGELESVQTPPPFQTNHTKGHAKQARYFNLRETRKEYLANIKKCKDALYAGESYEVCLTTLLSTQGPLCDAWQLYSKLRALNPAPYAAWLDFSASNSDAPMLAGPRLLCSSPERFLKGARTGLLEAKPIKGTAPRVNSNPKADALAARALALSEKDRAENLMIVDLLRNDLGRVCEPGSVHVPSLMEVESYATVHQLVSTVRGQRRSNASIADCLRAAFPGGSMTGAPKIRSMHILDELEGSARGPYAGSLGFISFNNAFDLNIIIRTAIEYPNGRVDIGAGGAIVVQSELEGEYEEMRLKAEVLLKAVGESDGVVATVNDL